jgi:hypothetical protein
MEDPKNPVNQSHQDEDDDDSYSAVPNQNQGSNKETSTTTISVGGPREESSFALLDGIHEDPQSGERERVTIAINRLPAILGRSHDTNDKHFYGLGKKKALSRKHCTIYYRDVQGGRVEWNEQKSQLQYHQPSAAAKDTSKENLKCKQGIDHLPSKGFFVVENLGKNRISVDGLKVETGESCVLTTGAAVRISSYMLYFLLPVDATGQQHVIVGPSGKDGTSPSVNKKKRKPMPAPSLAASAKKPKVMGPNYQTELDDLPTDDLIQMMDKAVSAGLWERRHQMIGTAIANRAVRNAAESPEIQTSALKGPGVARTEIMDWIEDSDKYGKWVQQMLVRAACDKLFRYDFH